MTGPMWRQLWEQHRGLCIGAAAGLFFGAIYLFFGFWDMLVFAFIMAACLYVGRKLERGELAEDVLRLYRWLTERWHGFK